MSALVHNTQGNNQQGSPLDLAILGILVPGHRSEFSVLATIRRNDVPQWSSFTTLLTPTNYELLWRRLYLVDNAWLGVQPVNLDRNACFGPTIVMRRAGEGDAAWSSRQTHQ